VKVPSATHANAASGEQVHQLAAELQHAELQLAELQLAELQLAESQLADESQLARHVAEQLLPRHQVARVTVQETNQNGDHRQFFARNKSPLLSVRLPPRVSG